jgi:hypothetical protein
MAPVLPLLLLALAAPGTAQPPDGPAVSTAAAPAEQRRARPEESPLTLNFIKDFNSSRVQVDYSLRWDFSDLKKVRVGPRLLLAPVRAISGWDARENTRVRAYGFSTKPLKMFIAEERVPGASPEASGDGGQAGAQGPAATRRRFRMSLDPLYRDLTENMDESLRRFALDSALAPVTPEWRGVSEQGKKEFLRDVLSLDVWEAPVLRSKREALEYISK